MGEQAAADDVRAITSLIERQFECLSWTHGGEGDWTTFSSDFFPDAALYPAARPARRQSVADFAERMRGLARTKLRSFYERVIGVDVQVFGNVAVAVAAGEMLENEAKQTRAVEMLLLVRSEGEWKIVAQAWDTEKPDQPLPQRLLGG